MKKAIFVIVLLELSIVTVYFGLVVLNHVWTEIFHIGFEMLVLLLFSVVITGLLSLFYMVIVNKK